MEKWNTREHWRMPRSGALLLVLAVLLAACGGVGGTTPQPTAAPAGPPVNGFGTAANHVHALLALPGHVLVLATHYGIYRSQDGGTTWQQVAGGKNQLMQGLMDYALSASPLDPQRLYVLTQPSVAGYTGIVGLYTSADQGRTWTLSIKAVAISTRFLYTVAAGNEGPGEMYVYLSEQGALGLKRSLDDGQHFSDTGRLPFDLIFGVRALPGAPGHLLVYGSQGLASSTDGGRHWQVLTTIEGGIQDVATTGPHAPIYASGDAGVYSSRDGGRTFQLATAQASYASLAVSPQQPQVVYGKTGLNSYRSSDGGRSWQPLPHLRGNLSVLAADPTNAAMVYLSLSYPSEVYRLRQDGVAWVSLTPPA